MEENHKQETHHEVTGDINGNTENISVSNPDEKLPDSEKVHGWGFYFLFYSIVITSIALIRPETKYLAYSALGLWLFTCIFMNKVLINTARGQYSLKNQKGSDSTVQSDLALARYSQNLYKRHMQK